ncbi:glycoprotein hormone alpha-2 [Podarcis lilfordi]|uniref:Glycoprotein hormone alpha-2 n=1 Tax=Podarcis lilfordi TaxID=74358 RepID=A0AA35PTU7_9SAUR|nr:glycoprotein hormone alpha-2 [Podarcis lilfordi]
MGGLSFALEALWKKRRKLLWHTKALQSPVLQLDRASLLSPRADILCWGRIAETPEAMPTLLSATVLSVLLATGCWTYDATPGVGCHLHPFSVTIKSDPRGSCRSRQTVQACVGYCESSAFPSKYSVLLASNFKHNITSVSQCCTIAKMQKIKVHLRCGATRPETIEVFTAKTCQCDVCRLSRY